MRGPGIVRKLDNLGRLVIPKEIRNILGINEGDDLEIAMVDNEVVVRKYTRGCIFCGSYKEIIEFNGALVCGECISKLLES